MKPITPKEVLEKRPLVLEPVFEVFNKLILDAFDGRQAVIYLEPAAIIVSKTLGIKKEKLYDSGYMDIEDHYREAGWVVVYSQPDRTENFRPHYTFKLK
jgi:hypothetical protein